MFKVLACFDGKVAINKQMLHNGSSWKVGCYSHDSRRVRIGKRAGNRCTYSSEDPNTGCALRSRSCRTVPQGTGSRPAAITPWWPHNVIYTMCQFSVCSNQHAHISHCSQSLQQHRQGCVARWQLHLPVEAVWNACKACADATPLAYTTICWDGLHITFALRLCGAKGGMRGQCSTVPTSDRGLQPWASPAAHVLV